MKGAKVAVAATATLLARGGVDTNIVLQTALTDLYLGGSDVTSNGAASFKFGTVTGPLNLGKIQGDLYGISATTGDVYVLTSEDGT